MSDTINKQAIINGYQEHKTDTGSSQVQIALLSARINHLTDHLKTHPKDFHSRRGLIAMTNRRRKLLEYTKSRDLKTYEDIIQKLSLRR